jgi:hypothetical protein
MTKHPKKTPTAKKGYKPVVPLKIIKSVKRNVIVEPLIDGKPLDALNFRKSLELNGIASTTTSLEVVAVAGY